MTRIAIFVEGHTERKFTKKLIGQRYGHLIYKITEIVRRGKDRFISLPHSIGSLSVQCDFFLIEVPSRDTLVSYIKDNATNMVIRQGFDFLLGLQDLYPNKRNDKIHIINAINTSLRKLSAQEKISVVLAIMETEAWFLCDWHMLERIDTRLTNNYIQRHLGIDVVNDDPELAYNHPSKTLDDILKLAEQRYRKHNSEIDTIIRNLDISYLFSCTTKINSLSIFIRELDRCIPHSRNNKPN